MTTKIAIPAEKAVEVLCSIGDVEAGMSLLHNIWYHGVDDLVEVEVFGPFQK
jgi:hypothetical protein